MHIFGLQLYSEIIRSAIEKWVKGNEDSSSISAAEEALRGITMETEDDYDVGAREMQVEQLSVSAGMNHELSFQCLEECGWDMVMAMEAFCRVRDAGLLPPQFSLMEQQQPK